MITLYEHQQKFLDYSKDVKYCILGDEVGLGKSISSLVVAKQYSKKLLIVCPAYLQNNWKFEAKRLEIEAEVVSYSKIPTSSECDMIIADEVQYLKNMSSIRTKAFHKLVNKVTPERLLLLSGTPILNSASEWWSALLLMSKDPNGTNGKDITKTFRTEHAFRKHFSNMQMINIRGRSIVKYSGSRNIDHLKDFLKGKYVKRSADKVLNLPEFSIQHIDIPASGIAGLSEEFEQFEATKKMPITSSKANSAISKASYTANFAFDLLKSEAGPLVIFTDHLKPIEIIAEVLKPFKVGIIQGSVDVKDRQAIVDKFQAGQLDVVLATIGSAATGFTLTKSRIMIFNDQNWVSANNAQCRGRIRRIGQKNNCIYYIMNYGTVDKKINEVLLKKEKLLGEF